MAFCEISASRNGTLFHLTAAKPLEGFSAKNFINLLS
jgi:hypothetical protein